MNFLKKKASCLNTQVTQQFFFFMLTHLYSNAVSSFFSRCLRHILVGLYSFYKVRLYEINLVPSVGLLEFLLLQLQTRKILGDKSELKLNVKKIIMIRRSRSWDSDCMVIL